MGAVTLDGYKGYIEVADLKLIERRLIKEPMPSGQARLARPLPKHQVDVNDS